MQIYLIIAKYSLNVYRCGIAKNVKRSFKFVLSMISMCKVILHLPHVN